MTYVPEKAKQIALARLDLVHKWLEFRRKSNIKIQADYDFVKLHNTTDSHLRQVLGKVSRGSLHRWNAMLDSSEDYEKLLPQYRYSKIGEFRTTLTDEEIKIFMSLLLHPNRFSIGKATTLTKYKLKEQGQDFIPADATLVGFLDWKSTSLVGYEIMLEENTQCIASALRNAIINLDMVPKIIYQDNGRAFRAKYFTNDKGFNELGFQGLYSKLGIETVFARPYNARAKVIERFFKEFQEGFEKLMPSYVGSNIANKPAYLMRNEKLHSAWHNDYIPTIEETIKMIDMWLKFKNSQTCPNAPNKTIAEILKDRKRQNINPDTLDDLMLATEVKTIQRNGVRFLGCDYFDERLYGFKSKVLIKYNLFDLTKIKVFTPKGEYLCTAERVTETHPMAKLLGDVKDYEDYKQKIVRQKQLKKKTVNAVKNYFSTEEIKYLESKMDEEISPPVQTAFKESSKAVQPLFKNNSQKYEYLIKHDPTNPWIAEFRETKEYGLLYE